MSDFATVIFAAKDGGWAENLVQLIIFLLVFGAPALKWLFQKLTGAKDNTARREASDENDTADEAGPIDDETLETSERIRRIREEVARRAAEARGDDPEDAVPPPLIPTSSRTVSPPSPSRRVEPLPASLTDGSNPAALLAELETARRKIAESQQQAAALKRGAVRSRPTAPVPEFAGTVPVRGLLGSKRTLRAAIVAREILSPPLALRREHIGERK